MPHPSPPPPQHAAPRRRRAARRATRLATAALALAGVVTASAAGGPSGGLAPGVVAAEAATAPAGVPGSAAFRAVTPCRLLDTRDDGTSVGPASSVTIDVVGRCGAGSTATAALVTLTAVEPAGAGYLTAHAAGAPRPVASTLNVSPADIRANTAVVPLGDGGIAVYAQPRTHLVVDLLGVWEPAGGPTAAGRFAPAGPDRVLDTRVGLGAPGNLAPGGRVRLAPEPPPGPAPAAVVLQLTATDAAAAGFVTAWPAGGARPLASSLNLAPGQTRANLVIVSLGDGGAVDLFTSGGGALVADVMGWITGPGAPATNEGQLVPLAQPVRLLDTREAEPATRLAGNQRLSLRVGGRAGIPLAAAAVAGNLTLVDPASAAFASAWPAGAAWPGTSTANTDGGRGSVAPAGVVAGLTGGWLDLLANTPADLVLDVSGWFVPDQPPAPGDLGGPVARLQPVPPPNDPRGLAPASVPADVTGVGDAGQAVSVEATGSRAVVRFWERGTDGRFAEVRRTTGLVGRSGVSVGRSEGDGSTPAGVYALTEAFGSDPAPTGTRLPFFRIDALDWWVSDSSSALYNTRQRCAIGTCPFREAAGEHLLSHGGDNAYRLSVVFGYNSAPVVAKQGSAMFLHVVGREPTSGCVSIPYADMAWALRWLDPSARPVILIGATGTRPA